MISTLLLTLFVYGNPPIVDFPKTLEPVGQFAIQDPGPEVISAVYIPIGHANDPFPLSLISKDKEALRKFIFDKRGLKDGIYPFKGVFAGATGEQKVVDFSVIIGKPVVTPPDSPVLDPKTKKFFVLIRQDGPSPESWSRMVKSAAWEKVQEKGSEFKPYTVTEARALNYPIPTKLPALIVYKEHGMTDTGKPTYIQDGEFRSAPNTDEDILNLIK